ncbi:unnamed protein product [Arabidopsis arenosa]|uniref:Uncharacterized protein n=1 Tax=Arabidopsis arenosa TaxID=38785 RepID=A0A8S1ZCK9_ARAAE|nr:unnamed protein product [Arabidopsis arenosa]
MEMMRVVGSQELELHQCPCMQRQILSSLLQIGIQLSMLLVASQALITTLQWRWIIQG